MFLRVTERYLDGRVSRVLDNQGASGYESVEHLRRVARSRGWREVRDIPGGVQHRTRGILSDSSWGEMLADVSLIDGHICARDNQGLCHVCGAEVAS